MFVMSFSSAQKSHHDDLQTDDMDRRKEVVLQAIGLIFG
jgi:hypothetical protein